MLSEYSVDVWFLYGSFTYGLETRICTYLPQSLIVEVALGPDDAPEDVARFLEGLLDNPRGLLRTELCIYGPGHEQEPVRLQTELAPSADAPHASLAVPVPLGSLGASFMPRLRFAHLAGLLPEHERDWRNLVTRVWPRLSCTKPT